MCARWGRERWSYGTFGTYWSVCVYVMRNFMELERVGVGADARAGSGRRESEATRGATTTTREDATRVGGKDDAVEVEVE